MSALMKMALDALLAGVPQETREQITGENIQRVLALVQAEYKAHKEAQETILAQQKEILTMLREIHNDRYSDGGDQRIATRRTGTAA